MRKLIIYTRIRGIPRSQRQKRQAFDVTSKKRFDEIVLKIFNDNIYSFGAQDIMLQNDERELAEARAVKVAKLPKFLQHRVRSKIEEHENQFSGIRSQRIDTKLWIAAKAGHASSAYQFLQRRRSGSGYGFRMEVMEIH